MARPLPLPRCIEARLSRHDREVPEGRRDTLVLLGKSIRKLKSLILTSTSSPARSPTVVDSLDIDLVGPHRPSILFLVSLRSP
jgi:hypothetical protein